jgi:hypothetical protein
MDAAEGLPDAEGATSGSSPQGRSGAEPVAAGTNDDIKNGADSPKNYLLKFMLRSLYKRRK